MKKKFIKYLALSFLSLVSLWGCEDKVDKTITWPEWASRPIIEDAQITAGGKVEITAGEQVNFSAHIRDNYNELRSYTLQVKYGSNVVVSKTENLSGNEASLNIDFIMPFAANLDGGGFYPEVSISADNVAGGENSTRISRDRNVSVARPESPASLTLIDENGKQFPLVKSSDYLYRTSDGADLSSLGTKIYIAEKVASGKPDYSGYVWGYADGKISVLAEEGAAIPVPSSEGYGFRKFGFNTYSFEIDKLVNLTVNLDKNAMESVSQSGVTYLAKEKVQLVTDCEVTFTGFGDLSKMLQADRFEILDDTSAKFTGHNAVWSFYYDTDTDWMILNYAVFNTSNQLWVTGAKACFPLGNDDSEHVLNYLAGDGKVYYATLAAIKDSDTDYHILVYLKEGYTIQPFRWVKWSTTLSMTTATPETAAITDKIFITPGSNFTPGLYWVYFHITKACDAGGDGTEAEISVVAYEQ